MPRASQGSTARTATHPPVGQDTAQRVLQMDLKEFRITESFRVTNTSQITEQREEPVGHRSPGNQAWFISVFNTVKLTPSLTKQGLDTHSQ